MNEIRLNDFLISKKTQYDKEIKNYDLKLLEFSTITLNEYEHQKKDILNKKNSINEKYNLLIESKKNLIILKNNCDKEITSLNENLNSYNKQKYQKKLEISSKTELLINEILEKIKQNNIKINLLRVELVKCKENKFSKNDLGHINTFLNSKKKNLTINNSIKNDKQKIKNNLELLEVNSTNEKKSLNMLLFNNQSKLENTIKKINKKLEILLLEYNKLTLKIKHLNNNITVLDKDEFHNKKKILDEKRDIAEKLEDKSAQLQNEYLILKKELEMVQKKKYDLLDNYNLNCSNLDEKYISERRILKNQLESYQKKTFKKLKNENTYTSINKKKEISINNILEQNLALNQTILTKRNILKIKLDESNKNLKNSLNIEITEDEIKNLNLKNNKLNNKLLEINENINKLDIEKKHIDNLFDNINVNIKKFVEDKNIIIELKKKKIHEMEIFENNYQNYILKLENDVNYLNSKEKEKQEKKQIIKNKIIKYEKELNRLN